MARFSSTIRSFLDPLLCAGTLLGAGGVTVGGDSSQTRPCARGVYRPGERGTEEAKCAGKLGGASEAVMQGGR